MIGKIFTVAASCAVLVGALAPAADASGGPGGGGGAGGGGTAASCQIKQLSSTPVLALTLAAIDSTYSLAGCAATTWKLTYVNTASATTDFTAGAAVDSTGVSHGTVHAAPLPYNYPYRVTLTVTNAAGSSVATTSGTLFTPKPKD